MINTLAVRNYRSLLDVVLPLGRLTVITGENGSGKSNLYKSLRLLSETAHGGIVSSLAQEGGLHSSFWAGPEAITPQMKRGEQAIEGSAANKRPRLRLGFCSDEFGYALSMGLPPPGSLGPRAFALDPEIKRECIWSGGAYRPAGALIDREACALKVRDGRRWQVVSQHCSQFESVFAQPVDPAQAPELISLKEQIRGWRFYDHFRSDVAAPACRAMLGTRTPVLHHDGRDLAAALQTIIEIGDEAALSAAVEDAFPGARIAVEVADNGYFNLRFYQHGLLRPLGAAELSDGTLRYLLWIAALLTPRPPSLMVLNEPETSLHPDLLPALGRLIVQAAQKTQVWVISHANRLVNALEQSELCESIRLEKQFGETTVAGQDLLNTPPWYWPDQSA